MKKRKFIILLSVLIGIGACMYRYSKQDKEILS